jgi:hypothetical protein
MIVVKDKYVISAKEEIEKFINKEENKEKVFYSRQLEVIFEKQYFHWITNRALRELEELGKLKTEEMDLESGSKAHIYWHPSYRYYKRSAKQLISLINEYSDPDLSADIGLRGESLVLEGFALNGFLTIDKGVNEFNGKKWTESEHNLDFIFTRDEINYGVEVKNMLSYMDFTELKIKLNMCSFLELKPIIVARMLPQTWINDVNKCGGFALILKYQLYPISYKKLAKRISTELGLPVDSPRSLEKGTMARVMRWHLKNVNSKRNSH